MSSIMHSTKYGIMDAVFYRFKFIIYIHALSFSTVWLWLYINYQLDALIIIYS